MTWFIYGDSVLIDKPVCLLDEKLSQSLFCSQNCNMYEFMYHIRLIVIHVYLIQMHVGIMCVLLQKPNTSKWYSFYSKKELRDSELSNQQEKRIDQVPERILSPIESRFGQSEVICSDGSISSRFCSNSILKLRKQIHLTITCFKIS